MANNSYYSNLVSHYKMAVQYPIERELGKRICLEQVPVCTTRYATCHTSVIVTGKKGTAPGELYHPYCVTIHKDTHEIFVTNYFNHRVEIFSETGEFLYQLGVGLIVNPYGIAIHGDSVYVSCWNDTVSNFSLTEMCRVKRIGGKGSSNGQFNFPHQLTTDHLGCVFIDSRLR